MTAAPLCTALQCTIFLKTTQGAMTPPEATALTSCFRADRASGGQKRRGVVSLLRLE
jgi:hypothetical protein